MKRKYLAWAIIAVILSISVYAVVNMGDTGGVRWTMAIVEQNITFTLV